MVTVEIHDPSPVYVEGLVAVLGRSGMSVAAPSAGHTADVLLVNPSLLADPRLVGLAADTSRMARVLLIGDRGLRRPLAWYMRAGAGGLVFRDAAKETIVDAVRRIAEGERFWDSAPAAPAARARLRTGLAALSPREHEVLGQIARGLTHGQIATRLAISHHTVDTHVKKIRAKLALGNKADLTRVALLGATGD